MSARPYRLGKRAEGADKTRRRILDAAGDLVSEVGFHPVSIDEVAARAGVGRASVYRHFGSKSQLLEAVTWEAIGRAPLERLDAARQLPDVTEALREFLRENCRFFAKIGSNLRAALNLALDEPEVAHIIDATYFGRRVRSLEQLAGRLHDEGALAEGWTRDRVVEALMILTGLEAFEVLTERRNQCPEEAAETLFAMAAGFLRSVD